MDDILDIVKGALKLENKYCCPDCAGEIDYKPYITDKPTEPYWWALPGREHIRFEWKCKADSCDRSIWTSERSPGLKQPDWARRR